jgi:hypothetical protein
MQLASPFLYPLWPLENLFSITFSCRLAHPRTLAATMSSEGLFSLMHLSEITKLRQSVERHFSSAARATCQTTSMFVTRESSDALHGVHSSNKSPPTASYDLFGDTKGFMDHTHALRSSDTARTSEIPRLQKLEPLRGIFEIVSERDLVMSPESFLKYSKHPPSQKLALADENDLDYRSAVLIFRIWRDMFSSGGKLSGFKAITHCKNGLLVNITYHAVSDESIPELSMIFDAVSDDGRSCCCKYLCCFNGELFHPECFTLSVLKVFAEQLVQLITAKIRIQENGGDANHPQKRPALEK